MIHKTSDNAKCLCKSLCKIVVWFINEGLELGELEGSVHSELVILRGSGKGESMGLIQPWVQLRFRLPKKGHRIW